MAQLKSTNVLGNLSVTGNNLASKFIKLGGTSDQILMADGSTSNKSDLTALINAAVTIKGTLGTGGTITSLPTASASNLGHAYKVITPGKYNDVAAKIGDMFICYKSGTSSYTWMYIPSGDDIEDTWRPVQVNGSQVLDMGNTTDPINLKAGTNVSISNSGGTVTFAATDTGATSIETTGSGNAVTSGSYDSATRKITLSKGNSFLPLSGGTLTGALGFKNNYLIKPVAEYRTTTSNITGAITIILPAGIHNTMVSMWIDVYNYYTNTSFSVHVGGYTFSNSTWLYNPFAMVYGADHKVRLGHNGTNFIIYIGELSSIWLYPQISVRDVILGYTPYYDNWYKDWTISFTSDEFKNVTATLNDKAWTTRNDGSGSGLDADLLDGKHAADFANSTHTHDDRYYTESEIDTKLNGKADTNHTHSNYLPLSGGALTGVVKGGLIDVHPENSGTVISYYTNDLAYLLQRGGSCVAKNITQSTDITVYNNWFDASPSYGNFSVSATTDVVQIIIKSPTVYCYGTTGGIGFGAEMWRAKSVKIEMGYSATNTGSASNPDTDIVWVTKINTTNNNNGVVFGKCNGPNTSEGGNSASSWSYIRITLTNWNTKTPRIAQIFTINYDSVGMHNAFLSRSGGTVYGSITPYANNSYNLGTDSKRWANIYANNIYQSGTKVSVEGHTHNYAGSSSAGGAATSANKVNSNLIVKLNGGSTEGTNLFTFNGSAEKTINITPSAIGASAKSHTHDALLGTGVDYGSFSGNPGDGVFTYKYRIYANNADAIPGSNNNANAVIKFNLHHGNYWFDLGFNNKGEIYRRYSNGSATAGDWKRLAFASEIPTSLKNPYALTFGSKTYDGSSAQTITASDLGALTSSDISGKVNKSGDTMSGNLSPSTNKGASLGTSSSYWNNIYGTTIYENGTSLANKYSAKSHTHDFGTDITNRGEAFLAWGGKNFAGSYGPIDAAMVPALGANRMAFAHARGITVEYSRDNGTTWTDYGLTDVQKTAIFSGTQTSYSIIIGKPTYNSSTGKYENASVNNRLRIIVDTNGSTGSSIYTVLNKFIFNISTNRSTGCKVTIDAQTKANSDAGNDIWTTFANGVDITGWSGYNVINTSSLTTYGNNSAQYTKIRFTFYCTGDIGIENSGGLQILNIYGFGGMGWQTPSNMAKWGSIYSYDVNQNAYFPANITSSTINSYNVYPRANNTYNLGDNTHRWAGVYATAFYENGTALSSKYAANTIATSTTLGLVKSSTTGTTANRDYNVQVNSDGTMKVNVPWTDTTYTFNGAVSTIKDSNLTASRALISNSSGKVAVSDITSTELSYLDGVTSNIQTQLNAKANNSGVVHTTGDETIGGLKTFSAPTNISGTEQATIKVKTANGGAIILGKEGPNSGTMLRLDQSDGTCRLRFRSSSTAGAMVWEQPESGSSIFMDVSNVYFRASTAIYFNNFASAGYLYTDSSGALKKGTMPTSLKNPNALTFGSKTYDGSSAQTITASDLGALTSHQDISGKVNKSGDTMSGNLNPSTNKGASLGTSSLYWNNIYGTTIYENGTALSNKYQEKGNYALASAVSSLEQAVDSLESDVIAIETDYEKKKTTTLIFNTNTNVGTITGAGTTISKTITLTDSVKAGDRLKVYVGGSSAYSQYNTAIIEFELFNPAPSTLGGAGTTMVYGASHGIVTARVQANSTTTTSLTVECWCLDASQYASASVLNILKVERVR